MQKGSRVKLKETSKIGDLLFSEIPNENWKLNDNPLDLEGTIIKIGNPKPEIKSLPVIVLWSNGLTNSYDYCNLIEL